MALQLIEGQDIGVHYSLLHRITEGDKGENWLALDKNLNERVVLKIFNEPLNESTRSRISANLSSLKGLVHPNIARVYDLDQHEGMDYISCQYIRGARPWEPSAESFTVQWPFLQQVFDALEFAHSLSVAHGHLHPGNLLIDEKNNLYISDFGLPPDLHDRHTYREYLSPQILQGKSPDVSDDIYSLGCHLFQALTGRPWQQGETFRSDSPIPDDIRQVVTGMLNESPYDRPARIDTIRKTVEQYATGDETSAPIEVQRPGAIRQARDERQPTAPRTHRLPRERRLVSASTALAGLAILILLAGAIFFLLPEREPAAQSSSSETQADSQTSAQQQAPSEPTGPGPIESARLERLKEEGQDLANKVVQRQVRLEDQGVQIWAPERYQQISEEAAQGDALYREGEYREAIEVYEAAMAALEDLMNDRDTIKQRHVEAGEQALKDGDHRKAIEAYTVLTAMEPDNEAYAANLERAENLEEVLSHMERGRGLEKDGKLSEALAQFRQALELDSKWQPASEAIERTENKIAQRNFTDAMSRGFNALSDDRYEEAKQAFTQAQKIFPDSPEPANGLDQVELAKQLDTIEAHKEVAENYEASEQWQKAMEEYKAALAIDDSLTFAQRGIETAGHRLEVNEQLDKYLNQPTIMQDDDELAAARKLIAEASRIDNPGPNLKQKISDLSRYVSVAREPVTLEVTSDNKTRVTVYKVGRLGKIESRKLEVHPGEYTIVGKRDGYRDVQKTVTILAGQGPESVYISCTEKI